MLKSAQICPNKLLLLISHLIYRFPDLALSLHTFLASSTIVLLMHSPILAFFTNKLLK